MNRKNTFLFILILISFFIYSCGDFKTSDITTSESNYLSNKKLTPQSSAKILEFINHWTTNIDELYYNVKISKTAASNIFAHKCGKDGLYGTKDDKSFHSIQQLKKIKGVTNYDISKIEDYEVDWTPPKMPIYSKALEFVNIKITSQEIIDEIPYVSHRAAENIIEHRNGPDGIFGTEDDNLFETAFELDSVSYVGVGTINRFQNYAENWVTLGVPSTYVSKIDWAGYSANFRGLLYLPPPFEKDDLLRISNVTLDIAGQTVVEQEIEFKICRGRTSFDAGEGPESEKGKGNSSHKEDKSKQKTLWYYNDFKVDTERVGPVRQFNIYWNKVDGYAIFNLTVDFDSSVFPSGAYTYPVNTHLITRIAHLPFVIDDKIGDDEHFQETNQYFWEYKKYGSPLWGIDSDFDGLTDDFEDANVNGIVDPGESDPNDEDSDGDGFLDGEEVTFFHTDPMNIDSDLDGIADHIEIFGLNGYFTDPAKYDTDGDSLSDGFELKYGYNPLSVDSDNNGINDGYQDPDGDGRPNWNEAKYYTNPNVVDTEKDGPPFRWYVKRFNPGPGGTSWSYRHKLHRSNNY